MRTLIDFHDAPVFAIPTAGGVREGVLVEGPQGWGEFSPPAACDDMTAARWLTAAMEPGTVGWPDAVRGRVPVLAAQDRVRVSAGDLGWAANWPDKPVRGVVEVGNTDDTVALIERWSNAAAELELVELVCGTAEEAAAVWRRTEVPIAVDATVLAQAQRPAETADIAVLRCGALGGVRRALRCAERVGLPCLVHLTGKTSIGVAGDVALAAALPELPFACSPGSGWPYRRDVVAESRWLRGSDGFLPAAPTPAAPDPTGLAQVRVTDAATIRRWQDLLHRAATAP
ncbi:MAG: O-succinylbenzoate-CoA synthase [Actinomycetia bacterium]|nr:O-succinylbenzoate-CoA synthase [Actinomycetes bacterium]MCH9700798.1 O-succinylbenzoate-CoA synthase [Actinomycetes bacterium]MCH9760990.1 O-succinylbenzoate-CoA synthase [Actinomycetes bacterium]